VGVNALKGGGGGVNTVKRLKFEKGGGALPPPPPAPLVAPCPWSLLQPVLHHDLHVQGQNIDFRSVNVLNGTI